jgi:pyrroline-5-carboxylate reductase
VADPLSQVRDSVAAQFKVAATVDNERVARSAASLFLAVRPHDMQAAASALAPIVAKEQPLLLSVAAGVRLDALARWLGGYRGLVRVMPNRPALLRKGVSALFAHESVTDEQRARAEWLMSAVGATVWVEREEQLDAVTAVSGSGPAYFFLLMELLESAGREQGLPAGVARKLVIETAYGAAAMAREGTDDPHALRAQVASKGGTTAAALQVLEKADLRSIVSRAVAAACRRAAELGEQSTN